MKPRISRRIAVDPLRMCKKGINNSSVGVLNEKKGFMVKMNS